MDYDYFHIRDMDLEGKKVIVRAEFNVPLDENQNITNDSRIRLTLPTIDYILKQNIKQLIFISKIGRPKGKIVPEMSLKPVAERLSELINQEVVLVENFLEGEIPDAKIIMLENIRFYQKELDNDEEFGKKLASFGDVYVNDAFGMCHRKEASMIGIPKYIPSCAGFLVDEEINKMQEIIRDPERPYVFIFGASKLDKIEFLEKMLEKCDKVLMGGGIVFTFLKARGKEIGASILDEKNLGLAKQILEKYDDKIVLPEDILCAEEMDETSRSETYDIDSIPKDMKGLDIGEKSIAKFKGILKESKTVVWNGPLGVFEIDRFGKSTKEIGEFITSIGAKTLCGGGDTAAAMKKFGLENKFTHVSSGGGASMVVIEEEPLPAVVALADNKKKFSNP